jgi:hypothetical protein
MTEMNMAVNEILEGKKAPTHCAGLASLIFNWQNWRFSASLNIWFSKEVEF